MNVIQGCIEDLISLLLEVCFGDAVEPCALGGLAFCGRVHRDVEFADRSDDVFGHLALVCFETSRPTTHEDPVYYVDGILHYCVANIPGAVPYSSTLALTNATLPYVVQLADKGWRRACKENRELELGLNIVQGKVVYRPVAEAWGIPCEPLAL